MYQTRRFEAVLPPVSVAAWPGLHSFGSSRAPLWKVLPDKRLLENTGAALVHPASPEMNALPRWLLLALFALLIVAPSESLLRRSSFGAAAETVGAWPSCRALLAPLSSLTRRCARADLMVPVCAEDTGDEVSPLAQPHTHHPPAPPPLARSENGR